MGRTVPVSTIKYRIENGIGVLKIDRPEALNALNRTVIDEMDEILSGIQQDPTVRVLILASDKNFAAGADIKEMVGLNAEEAKIFSFSATYSKLANLEIPTIASIQGFALGGGLELALACDFRIASNSAKLGFPEINLGIMPGAGGTVRAPRLIGPAKAKELILFGTIISSKEAENIGLINLAVEDENLMETTMKWADKLNKKAPLAVRIAKQTIHAGLDATNLEQAIMIEGQQWADMFLLDDQKEGMEAFIQKRKPIYQGK